MARIVAMLFVLIALGPAAVSAQPGFYGQGPRFLDPDDGPYPYRGKYPNPYYQGRAFGAPAAFCQKLCVQDFAPCDPPEFKHADGRCTNPARRF